MKRRFQVTVDLIAIPGVSAAEFAAWVRKAANAPREPVRVEVNEVLVREVDIEAARFLRARIDDEWRPE